MVTNVLDASPCRSQKATTMKKNIFLLLSVLFFSGVLFTACSDDEYTSRGDLFQPRFINDPVCTVDSNNAAIAWYDVTAAKSYTVQVFTDNYYQNLFREYTTEDPYIDIQDVPFATAFYVRVRSNAQDSVHNSQWATTNFRTTARGDYARLLQAVSKMEITDSTAIIRWTVDPNNPVDSISVEPTMSKTLPGQSRFLTSEERTQGWALVTGLVRNTMYTVNIYDSSKPRTYDKPYNEVTFKTTGPAARVINVALTDNLSAMLAANNDDSDVPEGTEYHLPAGSTFTISAFSIKKGFRLVGESGGDKPIVIINGSFKFESGAYISEMEFNNLEIRNVAAGQYFINDGNPYTLEQMSITNCAFRNIMRGFWRHQGENTKHIMNLEIESTTFDQCGWQTGTYGMFYFGSAGKSAVASYDRIDNLTLRNCTFSRGGYSQNNKYGWGNLVYMPMSDCPMNLTLENITIYDYCVNNRLIDLNNAVGSKLTIRGLLLASPCGDLYRIASETTTYFGNNYTTRDYALGGAKMNATDLEQTATDLFVNPSGGDYTIRDHTSPVYVNRAGDHRWIK